MLKKLLVRERDVQDLNSNLRTEIAEGFGLSKSQFGQFTKRTLPNARQSTFEFGTASQSFATDQRGAQRPVVEIAKGRGWRALAGASLTWSSHDKKRLAFVDCQVIVFLREIDAERDARQLLRLEWESLDGNDERNFEGGIAHPHWQIDLSDFEPQPAPLPSDEILTSIPGQHQLPDLAWSSHLHLAAAARWTSESWTDDRPVPHVSGPQTTDEVRKWMGNACRYVRYQMSEAFSR